MSAFTTLVPIQSRWIHVTEDTAEPDVLWGDEGIDSHAGLQPMPYTMPSSEEDH